VNPAAALVLDELTRTGTTDRLTATRWPRRAPAPFPHRPAIVAAARAQFELVFNSRVGRTKAQLDKLWRDIHADGENLAYHPDVRGVLAAGLRALADAFPDPEVARELADRIDTDYPFRLEDVR
jgi:hypothetical protein